MIFNIKRKKHLNKNIIILLSIVLLVLLGSIFIIKQEINNQNYYKLVDGIGLEKSIKQDEKILVYFFKDNCSPCVKFKKILNSFIVKSNETVLAINIGDNSDTVFEITEKYSINYTPTIIYFKNKKEIEKIEGLPSQEKFNHFIEKYNNS